MSRWPAAVPTCSPARTSTLSTSPSIGDVTVSRSISVRACSTWARARLTALSATAISSFHAPALSSVSSAVAAASRCRACSSSARREISSASGTVRASASRAVRRYASSAATMAARASLTRASLAGTSSGLGSDRRRWRCAAASARPASRTASSAAACRVSMPNSGVPTATRSPADTWTRSTTPETCVPTTTSSVIGSTIPEAASVRENGAITGGIGGAALGSGWLAR